MSKKKSSSKVTNTEIFGKLELLSSKLEEFFGKIDRFEDRFATLDKRIAGLENEVNELRIKIFGNGVEGFYQDYTELRSKFYNLLEACIANGIVSVKGGLDQNIKILKWSVYKEWGTWIIRVIGLILISLISTSVWCGFPTKYTIESIQQQQLQEMDK